MTKNGESAQVGVLVRTPESAAVGSSVQICSVPTMPSQLLGVGAVGSLVMRIQGLQAVGARGGAEGKGQRTRVRAFPSEHRAYRSLYENDKTQRRTHTSIVGGLVDKIGARGGLAFDDIAVCIALRG